MYTERTKSKQTKVPSSASLNFIENGTHVSTQSSLELSTVNLMNKNENRTSQNRQFNT